MSTVVGVPLGTLLGQALGWRVAFVAGTILGAVALVATILFVPPVSASPPRRLRAQAGAAFTPRAMLSRHGALAPIMGAIVVSAVAGPAVSAARFVRLPGAGSRRANRTADAEYGIGRRKLMILVTGATGNVGGEVVKALAAIGHPVRALTRHQGTESRFPPGVEVATGFLDRPETLRDTLSNVSGVFLLPGYPDMPRLLSIFREAAVERVVLLSGSSAASGGMTNAITAYIVKSEQAVESCGLAATILRPSAFMSNTLRWAPQLAAGDVVRAPFADVRIAMIDPTDIALVAALALTGPGHDARTHRLTGPKPLLPVEQVQILSQVLGRKLRFEAQSDAEARKEMSAVMPTEYVDAFFDFYVDGSLDESVVLPTVYELTGHTPRTFKQWARAHADRFT